ncbi:hypothetical protein JHW43_003985 [Diplocarpon mali]|nr:hypothetical protein JHW43_003985 [Diplocarpon mali]
MTPQRQHPALAWRDARPLAVSRPTRHIHPPLPPSPSPSIPLVLHSSGVRPPLPCRRRTPDLLAPLAQDRTEEQGADGPAGNGACPFPSQPAPPKVFAQHTEQRRARTKRRRLGGSAGFDPAHVTTWSANPDRPSEPDKQSSAGHLVTLPRPLIIPWAIPSRRHQRVLASSAPTSETRIVLRRTPEAEIRWDDMRMQHHPAERGFVEGCSCSPKSQEPPKKGQKIPARVYSVFWKHARGGEGDVIAVAFAFACVVVVVAGAVAGKLRLHRVKGRQAQQRGGPAARDLNVDMNGQKVSTDICGTRQSSVMDLDADQGHHIKWERMEVPGPMPGVKLCSRGVC